MYSKLSSYFDITLLSPTYADHNFEIVTHSDTFREYRVPKADSIYSRLHRKLDEQKVCSEVSALACALSSVYPNDYHKYYFELYESADIIVHDFPYMVEYDMLWGFDDKPRVYNSHNVEYMLLKQLYGGEKAVTYLEYIFGLEKKAVTESDLVFATSEDEKNAFMELYGVGPEKIALAPNGIDPEEIPPAVRKGKKSVFFIGSQHPPNIDAVEFIIEKIAPKCPGMDFLIAGSCCNAFKETTQAKNVSLLGRVDEKTKQELFTSADIALNPMFSGAGTNLKTLEFLSAGFPLISSAHGVRGLGLRNGEHFIEADKNSFPERIADLMGNERLREKISRLGRLYVDEHYSWKNIAETVRNGIDGLLCSRKGNRKRILLLNDFRVSSPSGGGEIRINRLYSALSRYHDVLLLCLNNSPLITRFQITQSFTEISFPKTQEHIAEEKRTNDVYWLSATDIVNSYMIERHDFFLNALGAFYKAADLVVLSHPYMFPALKHLSGKPLIHESHNFEYGLKKSILANHPLFETLIAHVESVEKAACLQSSLVIGVSQEDGDRLVHFSGIPAQSIYVVRNGVKVKNEDYFSDNYAEVKNILCGKRSILFIGSGHSPNISALRFVIDSLAPRLPHCIFLIIGTVCNAFKREEAPGNVFLFGKLEEAYKEVLLKIADVAINPMVEGSGSNLKLAEYMANKLPTVTTKMGARGYEVEDGREVIICELPEFAGKIENLLGNDGLRHGLSEQGYAYACRALDWRTLANKYHSILDNTVFKTEKKKLLVLTYRFTIPPLGGAEVYLLNVLKEIDRLGDFAVTVCTLNIHDIANKFHFSSEYTYDNRIAVLPGMHNTSALKFGCNRISDDNKLGNARRLSKLWMEESVLSSLRHIEKYTFPMLMGGWHYPENIGGHCEVWSSDSAYIYVVGTEQFEIQGNSPSSDMLSLLGDADTLHTSKVNGRFCITVNTARSKWVKLSINPIAFADDPRPLGVKISGIRFKMNAQWYNLKLNYSYRDFLKERHLEGYIEELISIAESRPPELEDLFQYTRGPVSDELENWLDRNIANFDIVLGHSVPFSTSVLATKYAKKYDKPVVILPHFHMDDLFYHWKSYYDALRGATAVLAFPKSSLDAFYRKIGATAHYIQGGAVYTEEHADVDASEFSALYGEPLPFFLVLGRKAGAKNYRLAIDAVKKVNANKKLCNLVIIGRDEDGEKIAAKDAFYLGEQPRDVVLGALKECVGLINMSESESFGIVVLEAWMQKKPVIVNKKCGAFVELVDDTVTGLLANRDNLADKIRLVLQDTSQAKKMGEKGFDKVQKDYTWESIGRTANKVALSLLSAFPSRRACNS